MSLLYTPLLGEITLRLVIALFFGALVGLERSYHGRPAGFRTHALVCLASSSLMLVTVYEHQWFRPDGAMRASIDPTRMAQGIMTGIGFLGAGVIMKDGLSVRGLTTAASIWITAGMGILVGIGFFVPAALTTALTFGALGGFRWIERRIKTEAYAHFSVRFTKGHTLTPRQLTALVKEHGFSSSQLGHHYGQESGMEYRMVINAMDPDAVRRLSEALSARADISSFTLSPTGD